MGILDKIIKKEEHYNIDEKSLELENLDLQAQLNAYKDYVKLVESENSDLKKGIKSFCKSVLDNEYAQSQIWGGDLVKLEGLELLNCVSKEIKDKNTKNREIMLTLVKDNKEKEQTIEDLKKQIMQFLENKDLSQEEIMDLIMNNSINSTIKEETGETPDIVPKNNTKTIQKEDVVMQDNNDTLADVKNITKEAQKGSVIDKLINKDSNGDEVVTVIEIKDKDISSDKNLKTQKKKTDNKEEQGTLAHVIDLNSIMSNMPELHWRILESIGIKQLSETNDIAESLREYYEDIKSLAEKTKNGLSEMVVANILEKSKVVTGWRTFFVYSLSDTGKRIFSESGKFEGQELKLCEKELLVKQHSSLNHGYGIKDSANMLIEQGYMDVSYHPNENKIELPNGDDYIPDIIAKNPITGEKEYFEYELVHHKQKDFERKCNKMKTLTSELHFITPTTPKRDQLKVQVDGWRYTMGDKIKDIKVYITTTRALKKGKWDVAD